MAFLDTFKSLLTGGRERQTRPARRLNLRRFDGAGTGRRAQDWLPQGPINSELGSSKVRLDGRAKSLFYNSAYAAAGVNAWITASIGTGAKPHSQLAGSVADTLSRLWPSWGRQADADGLSNVYGLQALAMRQLVLTGEIILVRIVRNGHLRWRLLPSEMLAMDMTQVVPNGGRIVFGIEFNADGERVAYHLHKNHPAEGLGLPIETIRLAAADVIHCFAPLEAGQVRGLTWLAAVMTKLRDLERIEDFELERKKVQTLFAGFITEHALGDVDLGESEDDEDGLGPIAQVEGGTVVKLNPGETIDFPQVPQDADQGRLAQHTLRAIAAGLGVPAHLITRDLSQANYSSLRADLVEFRRSVELIRASVLIPGLLTPLWRSFVLHHVMAGALPATDSDLMIEDVEWRFPRWPWVDPLKDLQAEELAIKMGVKSRAQTVAELGHDVEALDQEIARDRAREMRLGLEFGSAEPGSSVADPKQRRRSSGGLRRPQNPMDR